MNENNEASILDEEIQTLHEQFNEAEPGSKEQTAIVDSMAKLQKTRQDEFKLSNEALNADLTLQETKKQNVWHKIFDGAKIVIPAAVTIAGYVLWNKKLDQTAEFEENGVWRSDVRKEAKNGPFKGPNLKF